jgi:hypothetical protein
MGRIAAVVITSLALSPTAQAQCTSDAESIVRAIYAQLLERQPDRNSRMAVYDIAAGRGSVRENVAGVARSVEHQARFLWPPVVDAAFRATRGAQPDRTAVEHASVALARGETTLPEVIARFAAEEAATHNPDRQVWLLYDRLLGRSPDGNTMTEYRQVADRAGVLAVARALTHSREYQERFGRFGVPRVGAEPYEAAIRVLYRHLLGREPDPSGLQMHARSAARVGFVPVIEFILNSEEYQRRFGEMRVPGPGEGTVQYCAAQGEDNGPRIAQPRR